MTTLRIVDKPEGGTRRWAPKGSQSGDMWRDPSLDIEGREAWAIVLPNDAGVWFTTERAGGDGAFWTVTGTPPAITVQPSINAEPEWHGFIRDGEFV